MNIRNNIANVSIILSLVISLVSTNINFDAYTKGYMPTPFQAFFSILCVLTWILLSMYNGYKKNTRYFKFCSLFWGIGLVLFIVGYTMGQISNSIMIGISLIIAILPALVVAGPLYGLRYFINIPSDIFLVIINVSATYLSTVIAFIFGKFFSNRNP